MIKDLPVFDKGYKEFIASEIMDSLCHNTPGRALTLPGDSFEFENILAKSGWDVWGYEKNPARYRRHKASGIARNIQYVKDFVHTATGDFDFGWLDYCGALCKTGIQALDIQFKNEALVVFTFLAARETPDMYPYINRENQNSRLTSYIDILVSKKFMPVKIYKYNRVKNGKSSPMFVFFTRKVKSITPTVRRVILINLVL